MSRCELFPSNQPSVIKYNIKLLIEYYIKHQHRYYKNILDTHFTRAQPEDTRFIPTSLIIPHI